MTKHILFKFPQLLILIIFITTCIQITNLYAGESKGVAKLSYTGWDGHKKQMPEVRNIAKIDALERFVNENFSKSRFKDYMQAKSSILSNLDSLVTIDHVLQEDIDKKNKTITIVIRANINENKLNYLIDDLVGITNAAPSEKSEMAIYIVARKASELKVFKPREFNKVASKENSESSETSIASGESAVVSTSNENSISITVNSDISISATFELFLLSCNTPFYPEKPSPDYSENNYEFSSVVLRDKSQYRMYYSGSAESTLNSKGITGTLTARGFEWTEVRGIQAPAIASGFNFAGKEKVYHGDRNGYIYNHDTGSSFNPEGVLTSILAEYQSPDYDYGDFGTLKTLDHVKVSLRPEGATDPTLRVRFDFDTTDRIQPPDVSLETNDPAIFGSSIFAATVKFGAAESPLIRQAIQGSGHSNFFKIFSEDTNAPYTINGLYINYRPSGRQ